MDIVLRAIVIFFVILLITRVVGKRERLTHEELNAEARLQQIGSLDEVRYAVLESNGKVSFLTRS